MKKILFRHAIHINKRYSAACEIRQLRVARRFGLNASNENIRQVVVQLYGW